VRVWLERWCPGGSILFASVAPGDGAAAADIPVLVPRLPRIEKPLVGVELFDGVRAQNVGQFAAQLPQRGLQRAAKLIMMFEQMEEIVGGPEYCPDIVSADGTPPCGQSGMVSHALAGVST